MYTQSYEKGMEQLSEELKNGLSYEYHPKLTTNNIEKQQAEIELSLNRTYEKLGSEKFNIIFKDNINDSYNYKEFEDFEDVICKKYNVKSFSDLIKIENEDDRYDILKDINDKLIEYRSEIWDDIYLYVFHQGIPYRFSSDLEMPKCFLRDGNFENNGYFEKLEDIVNWKENFDEFVDIHLNYLYMSWDIKELIEDAHEILVKEIKDELEKLEELFKEGVLTKKEFENKKADYDKILDFNVYDEVTVAEGNMIIENILQEKEKSSIKDKLMSFKPKEIKGKEQELER